MFQQLSGHEASGLREDIKQSMTDGVSMLDELDTEIADSAAVQQRAAQWVSSATHLHAGIAGNRGYDIGVGKYLKLPELDPVLQATIKAVAEKKTLYWDYPVDLPELISAKLHEENGIIADPKTEILTVSGLYAGVAITTTAFLNADDEVIVMDPDYVSHFGCVIARGAKLVFCPMVEHKGVLDETRWEFSAENLERCITPKTKMLILTNPNNPTGYVYSREDLLAIADIVTRHDLLVLTNECYERLIFSEEFEQTLQFCSLASLPGMWERTITIQGVTKSYHLSGYRVGWLVANAELMKLLSFVNSWTFGAQAPTISQWGTRAALTMPFRQDYTRRILKNYKQNIDIVCNALREVPGIECPRPMGSQFTFADISGMHTDDVTLSAYLYEKGIITVYGSPWGKNGGKNHLRLALSNPIEYEKACVEQLVHALKEFQRTN